MGSYWSPTLCLGHFKEKFSSTNMQPMTKEKFRWLDRVGRLLAFCLLPEGRGPADARSQAEAGTVFKGPPGWGVAQ